MKLRFRSRCLGVHMSSFARCTNNGTFWSFRRLLPVAPVLASPMVPLKSQKQRKELLPQSVFRMPPELDVSLLLEFVGWVSWLGPSSKRTNCSYLKEWIGAAHEGPWWRAVGSSFLLPPVDGSPVLHAILAALKIHLHVSIDIFFSSFFLSLEPKKALTNTR